MSPLTHRLCGSTVLSSPINWLLSLTKLLDAGPQKPGEKLQHSQIHSCRNQDIKSQKLQDMVQFTSFTHGPLQLVSACLSITCLPILPVFMAVLHYFSKRELKFHLLRSAGGKQKLQAKKILKHLTICF